MKFVHIADMHFDMPLTVLSKNGLAEERRLDQRNVFNKMMNYVKENNIEYLFKTVIYIFNCTFSYIFVLI